MDWGTVPRSGITALPHTSPVDVAFALDSLPDHAPAVLLMRLDTVAGASDVLSDLITQLEHTTYDLYPAWLPGAEVSPGRGTIDNLAARSLASELAAQSGHYRPFVMDLTTNAVAAQCGSKQMILAQKYADTTRMSGLIRAISASFARESVTLALYTPAPIPIEQQRCVADVCDWLSSYVGIWLLDDITGKIDRFPTARVSAHGGVSGEFGHDDPWALPAVAFPPIAGRPHPASAAEQRLEAHLARRPWAVDRQWNRVVTTGGLEPFVRADLLWPDCPPSSAVTTPQCGRWYSPLHRVPGSMISGWRTSSSVRQNRRMCVAGCFGDRPRSEQRPRPPRHRVARSARGLVRR